MAQTGERKVILLPSTQTTVGAHTVADTNPLSLAYYTQAIFVLSVTAEAGTTPTLDVYIQQELPIAGASDKWGQVPTGTPVWNDLCHFTQVTTSTGTWYAGIVAAGNSNGPIKDVALAAATVISWPIGGNLRVKYATTAADAQYTFSVTAILIP